MELWRRVWRDGLTSQLSHQGLEALRRGLIRDDPRLVQGRTLTPPPLAGLEDVEIEAACVLCYSAWKCDGCTTVGEAAAHFNDVCTSADLALGEPGACRHFLDWYDATPRAQMRRLLLAEVELSLHERHAVAA